jgi:hypothetical protein
MTVPKNHAGTYGAFRPSRALVVIAATCGWHVYLQHTDGTAGSALRPQIVAKACLPFNLVGRYLTMTEIMGIGLSYFVDVEGNPPPWHHAT